MAVDSSERRQGGPEEEEEKGLPLPSLEPQQSEQDVGFLESFLEQDSTQIVAPKVTPLVIEVDESEKFKATSKNITLFRVLNDSKKSLERRVIPLLEMFKVETTYFRQLQVCCL